MVELMIVVGIIGLLASIAIPNYQKLTARSHRSEMMTALSKFKMFFKNAHDNNGTFMPPNIGGTTFSSAINPDPGLAPLGQPAVWDATRSGWTEIPFALEGGIRMRYMYKVDTTADTIEFIACGNFPAFGPATQNCLMGGGLTGNYVYDEVYKGTGVTPSPYPIELPTAF
jgi:type II secretory pathway pseudopilin PulG